LEEGMISRFGGRNDISRFGGWNDIIQVLKNGMILSRFGGRNDIIQACRKK